MADVSRVDGAIRVTVQAAQYLAWRRVAPGLRAPAGFEPHSPASDCVRLPTAAASVLAVFAVADHGVSLRLTGSPQVASALHLTAADQLAAAVMRVCRTGEQSFDLVQLILLPTTEAGLEAVSWLPMPGDGGGGDLEVEAVVSPRRATGALEPRRFTLEQREEVADLVVAALDGATAPTGAGPA